METGAISAETSQVLLINLIPKEGGNAFRLDASGAYSSAGLQSDNLTDALRARGATTHGHPAVLCVVRHGVACVQGGFSAARKYSDD